MDETHDSIIRLPEVIRMTGKCRSAIYQDIRDGRFPRQIKIGMRAVGWPLASVQAYVRAMIDGVEYQRRED